MLFIKPRHFHNFRYNFVYVIICLFIVTEIFFSFIVFLKFVIFILQVTNLLSELGSVLSNCVLTKDYVLDNSQNLVSLVRDCNITLRWLLLHRAVSPVSDWSICFIQPW